MTLLSVSDGSFVIPWQTLLIILVAVAVVVGVVFFWRKYREEILPKRRLEKNDHDRSMRKLKKILGPYIRKNDGRVIYSAEIGSKKTQGTADAVLIGYFGALVLVCCDLSGELYADDKSDKLTQIVKSERRQHDNPVLKARRVGTATTELLREKKVYKVPVESGVFFTGKATVNVPGSLNAFTPKKLRKALDSSKYLEDKGVDIDAAAEAILSWR